MRSRLIACVAGAFFVALLAAPAGAQTIVDGDMWLNSTPDEQKAYLIGAMNMLALETAYAKTRGTPPPVAGAIAAKALDSLTLDQITEGVTRWYEDNPDCRDTPVVGVIWIEMVDPRSPSTVRIGAQPVCH